MRPWRLIRATYWPRMSCIPISARVPLKRPICPWILRFRGKDFSPLRRWTVWRILGQAALPWTMKAICACLNWAGFWTGRATPFNFRPTSWRWISRATSLLRPEIIWPAWAYICLRIITPWNARLTACLRVTEPSSTRRRSFTTSGWNVPM